MVLSSKDDISFSKLNEKYWRANIDKTLKEDISSLDNNLISLYELDENPSQSSSSILQ